MITEWLFGIGSGFVSWVVDLMPQLDADVVGGASNTIAPLGALVGSMGVWVNWAAMAAQVALVGSLWFTFLAVRVVRALIGHIPLVGGNG